MKLGVNIEISLCVRDIEVATQFYEKLGFEFTYAPQSSVPTESMTDGSLILVFYQQTTIPPIITYYQSELEYISQRLSFYDIPLSSPSLPSLGAVEFSFADQTILCLRQKPTSRPDLLQHNISECGRYGGVALSTSHYKYHSQLLKQLGFLLLTDQSTSQHQQGEYTDQTLTLTLTTQSWFSKLGLMFFPKDYDKQRERIRDNEFKLLDIDPYTCLLDAPGDIAIILNNPLKY